MKIEISVKNWFFSIVVCSMITVFCAVFLIINGFCLVRDIDALIDRAQVSADREDMIEYLSELKENMEKRGMTSGHFALIFKTPANDFSLHYKSITRILERLESIKDIPKNETAYQVALSDLRGAIRELPNPSKRYLWTQYWYLYFLGLGVWVWPAVKGIKEFPYF